MAYLPTQIPRSIEPLTAKWLAEELGLIASVLNAAMARNVEFLNVEPLKPREGMIYGADGTNWNPGAGQGVYAYYNGAWNKLG